LAGVRLPNWGTPIGAAEGRTVSYAGWDATGFGNLVAVYSSKGQNLWRYAHLDRIDVFPGQWVGRGQAIGTLGSSGNSTGRHRHLAILWQGRHVDPLQVLP
jgi:murein DD-endopeptidase MepM/ murein hydrolase activator NlpD